MATDFICITDYTLDLDSYAVSQAPTAITESLQKLDADGNHKLTDDEAYGAVLATPLTGNTVKINTAQDLKLYDRLLHSAVNARPYARFAATARGAKASTEPVAEDWAIENEELYPENHGAALYDHLQMIDVRSSDKATQILFRNENSTDDTFYFSVNIPDNLNAGPTTPMTIEFNGNHMQLKELEKSSDPRFLKLEHDLLETLLAILYDKNFAAYFPNGFSKNTSESLEALLFQSRALPPDINSTDTARSPNSDLLISEKRVYSNQNPIVSVVKLAGVDEDYPIGLRGGTPKAPLTDKEILRTQQLLKQIPKNLLGVLAINDDTMKDFSIEIVEDNVMDVAVEPGIPGKCCNWLHKFLLRRSILSETSLYTDSKMRQLMTHELGHSLFPNSFDSSIPMAEHPQSEVLLLTLNYMLTGTTPNNSASQPKYFLNDYFADLTKQALVDRRLPSLGIYSLENLSEFIAECTAAYFKGETDEETYSMTNGTLSRAELRDKLPEMYLAMTLLFEEDSPYFGSLDLFSKKSKAIYDAILTSDQAAHCLDKNTPVTELASTYDLVDAYGKLPSE